MLRVIDSFLFEGDDDDNDDDYCRVDDDDVGGDDFVCSDDDYDDYGNKLLLHQYPFYYHLSSLNKDHLSSQ